MKDSATFIVSAPANFLSDSLRQGVFISDSTNIENTTDSLQNTIIISAEEVYGKQSILQAAHKQNFLPEPRNKNLPFDDFLALGLILLFLLIGGLIRRFIFSLFASLFSNRTIEKQAEETRLPIVTIATRVLFCFSIIVIGFSIGLLLPSAELLWSSALEPSLSWRAFLYATCGLFLFCFVKTGIMNVLGFVGKCKPLIRLLISFGKLTIIVYGLILFPLAVLLTTSPSGTFYNFLQTIIILLAVVSFSFYLFRVVQIFFKAKISIFFLILYLCSLEIVPFLVLFTFVTLS